MSTIRTPSEHLAVFELANAASRNAGSTNHAQADTWNGNMGRHENGLAIISASAIGTSLDIVLQDSPDGTTWTTRKTCTQITAAGLYIADFGTPLDRYVRAQSTRVGVCVFSVCLVGTRAHREPVSQLGTAV